MDTFGGGTAPCLSVHGHWLENAGFKVGASVSVEATVGQLLLTLVEFPDSTEPRHSSAFERHIAKLARAKPGDHVEHDHPGWLVREKSSPPWAPRRWISPTQSAGRRTSPNASSPATTTWTRTSLNAWGRSATPRSACGWSYSISIDQ